MSKLSGWLRRRGVPKEVLDLGQAVLDARMGDLETTAPAETLVALAAAVDAVKKDPGYQALLRVLATGQKDLLEAALPVIVSAVLREITSQR